MSLLRLPPRLADLAKRQNARRRWIAFLGGGALIAVGAVLVDVILKFAASMGHLSNMRPEELGPMIGGIALAVGGLVWIAMSLRRHRALVLASPDVSVTQAYIDEITTVGAGMYLRSLRLVCTASTGKEIRLYIGRSHDRALDVEANALLQEVAQLHPRARVGWTPEGHVAALHRMRGAAPQRS